MPDSRIVENIPVSVPPVPSADYPVYVGDGLWDRLPELLSEHCPAHRYALIADDRVAGLYAEQVLALLRKSGQRAESFTFPSGEANKSRQSWADLTDRMLAAGLGRDTAVLALGGGVVGDLAGFVAATYLRGVPLVQLPTTLLAMIDSSVGGKTGIDTSAGKNLVGAFHPPRVVVADVSVLRTLPPAELRAGLAEAIKHGAIADRDYLDEIDAGLEAILRVDAGTMVPLIVRSVQIKADVVSRDERETGPRKALNFGHTIGHAVEAASEFRLLHGEAVAIGMVAETVLGEAVGVTEAGSAERLRAVIERAGLPTSIPARFVAEDLLDRTRVDKKARAGRVEYVLLERLGSASWGHAVEDESVLAALRNT